MKCKSCNADIPDNSINCIYCNFDQTKASSVISSNNPQSNTSGQGAGSAVPPEVQGWCWGGFFWGWLWAIFNHTWIGLLALIPGFDLIIKIILGIKGREWAWQNKRWDSIDGFKHTQKLWTICGLVFLALFFLTIPLIAILSVAILATINPTEQMNKAKDAAAANNSAEVLNAIERYYAVNNQYPWGTINSKSASWSLSGEPWLDELVRTNEIKTDLVDDISQGSYKVIYDSPDNFYVCYLPLSKTKKTEASTICQSPVSVHQLHPDILCLTDQEYLCLP